MKGEHAGNMGSFKSWRQSRPFWGALFICLAGCLVTWIPVSMAPIAFLPGTFAFIGFIFGGLLLILGILAFFSRPLKTFIGIAAIFLSVLSLIGALGGLLLGTVFGIIGGALCFAWTPQSVSEDLKKTAIQKERRKTS
ncbi:DUF6114 domain-containing protein [Fictibacillus sp. Mic-4]|uniref:DUF6114 domain-containing protein n=1 Tax=Fictibacillus TaxID=1329200 RepID=UPI00040DF9AC|nr:DUF6114 domain-containing protein [Fictibacillus gelatini]